MTRHGRPALFGALALFVLFFANVALGAAGLGAPLGDIAAMLTLLGASVLFVAGVLVREAEAQGPRGPDASE